MKSHELSKNILFLILIYVCIIPFQSCEPDGGDDIIECSSCEDDEENDNSTPVRKPNIYIYPTENMELSVSLKFPQGGKVIKSIPEYGNGWVVNVDTNGMIDNSYSFLFYESVQPDIWQENSGWIVKQADLEQFFTNNMKEYGFNIQEINDFIEYWIPKLKNYEHYGIYPQNGDIINTVIEIDFLHQPDNILRLFYVIKECSDLLTTNLNKPEIDKSFAREDYCVTEWGVITK